MAERVLGPPKVVERERLPRVPVEVETVANKLPLNPAEAGRNNWPLCTLVERRPARTSP